jgi:3-deoxy-D-manno-octulosonic-acid transferase
LLEPALWSLPVLAGPHLFNFQEIAGMMEEAGGLQLTAGVMELESAIRRLLDDAAYRRRVGSNAYAVVEQNRGALQRLLAVAEELLAEVSRA